MKEKLPKPLLDSARRLRVEQTDAESLLWNKLRDRRFLGFKFRRQHPIPPYVLDFYCDEIRLGLELDGSHHLEAKQLKHDEIRNFYLKELGIKVLRFWNYDVLKNTETVLEVIYDEMGPHPHPHPRPLSQR